MKNVESTDLFQSIKYFGNSYNIDKFDVHRLQISIHTNNIINDLPYGSTTQWDPKWLQKLYQLSMLEISFW